MNFPVVHQNICAFEYKRLISVYLWETSLCTTYLKNLCLLGIMVFLIPETQRTIMPCRYFENGLSLHHAKAVWELWNTTERWHTALHWPWYSPNCSLQQPAVLQSWKTMLYVWVCCSWRYQTKGAETFRRPFQLSLEDRTAHCSSCSIFLFLLITSHLWIVCTTLDGNFEMSNNACRLCWSQSWSHRETHTHAHTYIHKPVFPTELDPICGVFVVVAECCCRYTG